MAKKEMAKKEGSKYNAAKELKSIINANIQYGLNTLEAVGDKAGEVVEGTFSSAKNLSEDTNELIGDVIKQTKKAYKESFDMARKQAKSTLGSK
jgi:hypothetical protein